MMAAEDPGCSAATAPAQFPDSPFSRVIRQPLILGLFLPVQSGGWSASLLPRTTDWTFDYNAALARRAEELGFDLVFGLAQWTSKGGYGGISKYREDSLDPFIAVTALSTITERILLISTIHVLFGPWHPLHIAKFGATIDHISGGRWGINVVTGYSPREARMFGGRHIEHDLRYEMAGEFTGLLCRLWGACDDLTWHGRFWSVEKAFITPKPRFGRPVLVNATGSPAGIRYAAAHSDLVFITSPAGHEIDAALAALPAHNAAIKAAGSRRGRQLRTIINPMIVCRATDREAQRYHQAILDAADHGAIEGFVAHQRAGDAVAWKAHGATHRALGGNIQIIGSPEHVVDKLIGLKRAGCDGVQVTFFDFAPDLEFFGEAVLPLMRQAGLRCNQAPLQGRPGHSMLSARGG
jgi:FMNH2-dependent dimethyl sulfone monooxygenase